MDGTREKRSYKTMEKLSGAEHFLREMRENSNYMPFIWNLDAFLGQCRAITLAMQSELHDYPGFTEWYEEQRVWMKKDPQMRLLLEFRNIAYHEGIVSRRLRVSHHPGQKPSIVIHWLFKETDDLIKKLSEFPRADVEKMFDTDTLAICETCYNKLQPLLFDFLGKNNQTNEARVVK